jgi:hypothetical protein
MEGCNAAVETYCTHAVLNTVHLILNLLVDGHYHHETIEKVSMYQSKRQMSSVSQPPLPLSQVCSVVHMYKGGHSLFFP